MKKSVIIFLVNFLIVAFSFADQTVWFMVDMSNETVSNEGVHMGGGDLGGSRVPMTDSDGDGIYGASLPLDVGTDFVWTYLNGTCSDYSCKEDLSQDEDACSFGEYNDRMITVPAESDEATVLDAHLFGTCVVATQPGEDVSVTFKVNMKDQTANPEGVYLAGGGFGQDGHLMSDADGDDIWEVTVAVAPNARYTYKFRNQPANGTWDGFEDEAGLISGECNVGEYNDRFVDVGSMSITVPTACYGECFNCGDVKIDFVVDMRQQETHPEGVYLAGGGFGQGGHLMSDTDGDDIWRVSVGLDSTSTVLYKFRNQPSFGTWDGFEDPAGLISGSCGFGDYNDRQLVVPNAHTTLETVCYGSCISCVLDPVDVTFTVNMANETPHPEGVYLAGGNFGQDGHLMSDVDGDGVWAVTLSLDPAQTVTYKFRNQPSLGGWDGFEDQAGLISGGCGVGEYNDRFFDVGFTDAIVPTACYGSCVNCNQSVVTFKVDMEWTPPNSDGVYLAGGAFGQEGLRMHDEDMDGVFEVKVPVDNNAQYLYKFRNQPANGGWDGFEDPAGLIAGGCNTGEYNDRFVDVVETDVVLPVVCYGTCLECVAPENIDVTFQVDMSNETVSDEGVHMGGGSLGESRIAMLDPDGNGVYETTYSVPSSSEFVFVYLNGLCSDYSCKEDLSQDEDFCAYGQYNDRSIMVGYEPMVTPAYMFGTCEVASFTFNSFDDVYSSSSDPEMYPENGFWSYDDEVENAANFITTTNIPADQSNGAGSGTMLATYSISHEMGWGGYAGLYQQYNQPQDLSSYNYLSFKVYNPTPASIAGNMELRVILFDVSELTDWSNTSSRDDAEKWFSFFKSPRAMDQAEEDGWVEYRIPLVGAGSGVVNYDQGFVRTGWSGAAGNDMLDINAIGGVVLEFVLDGGSPDGSAVAGDIITGDIMFDDMKAVFSNDIPGCMNADACNYNPLATVDDPNNPCFDCVDVTFQLDMSSVPDYEGTPQLAGGGTFGEPGDYPMTPVTDLPGVWEIVAQVPENFTTDYTFTSDASGWGAKENIAGQECAVEPYSDRRLTTTVDDMIIKACFGFCTENEFCGNIGLPNLTFSVNMMDEDTSPDGVWIRGGGFGSTGYLMDDTDGDDIWELMLPVNPNSTVTWKFSNGPRPEADEWGGAWEPTEGLAAGGCSIGEYDDRFFEMGSEDVLMPTVCFGECFNCAPDHPVDVTFNINMSDVPGFDGSEMPYIFGSFNDWDNFGTQTMMSDDNGDGIYTGTVTGLMSRDSIVGIFGFGSNFETVPEECGTFDETLQMHVREIPVIEAGAEDFLVLPAIDYGDCPLDVLSADDEKTAIIPTVFSYKTYPNPFNPNLTVYYELPDNEMVSVEIVNLLGQKVMTLVNEQQVPGVYSYNWNGKNEIGQTLQSGVYFTVISRVSGVSISKVTFLK